MARYLVLLDGVSYIKRSVKIKDKMFLLSFFLLHAFHVYLSWNGDDTSSS